jgi:hypothetical protein
MAAPAHKTNAKQQRDPFMVFSFIRAMVARRATIEF